MTRVRYEHSSKRDGIQHLHEYDLLTDGRFDRQLNEDALVVSDEIDESLGVVAPGLDDGGELAGEEVERIIGGHVVLGLAGMVVDVEEFRDDGGRLQSLADDEENGDDAANLMPKETRSHHAQLAKLCAGEEQA